MEQFLNNLRNKPEHKKQKIAFLTSFGIIILIFTFWITTLNSRIENITAGNSGASSPFVNISKSFASAIKGFDGIKNTLGGFVGKKESNPLLLEVQN